MKYLRSPVFSSITNVLQTEIVHQTERLCEDSVNERPTFLETLENAQNNKKHPIYLLDLAMAQLIGLSKTDVDKLYKVLISELLKYS